jgi:hypothetical protein
MVMARRSHSATLLPNGEVLIAGGDGGRTAELYDPATEIFRLTGDMVARHDYSSATRLKDGRVLVLGSEPGDLAELYDRATETFLPTGTTTPSTPTGTLLPDGKVLVAQGAGGECSDGSYPGFEIYDPENGTFHALAWTPWRFDVAGTANLLPNGKVLMILQAVECDYGGQPVIYDPASGSFTPGASLMDACSPTGTLLSDGSVLITSWAGAEIYDPGAGGLVRAGNMTAEHSYGATATLLSDGTLLIAGGTHDESPLCCVPGASAEIYHPAVLRAAPALLAVSGDGQGAILHASTHRLVSAGDPATAGEALEIYCTGLLDGDATPPQVAIGGRAAEVLYFGNAPGYAGLNQINVRVPEGTRAASTVPVRLNYLARPSNEVTIPIQ